jgi:hypothetical protein
MFDFLLGVVPKLAIDERGQFDAVYLFTNPLSSVIQY